MTLLREIQLLLERTYAPVPINLETCLIGETRCAVLNRLAGDSLYVAIFYSRPVIAELEANDPRRALNERNISALITFIEEIAHGVQAALLFQEGEREIDSEAYVRNLETQARIDTYLVLCRFAHLICGGRIPRRVGSWLRRQLFDTSHRRFTDPRLRVRYRAAQRCATVFLRRLRRISPADRPEILRHFRTLTWAEKLSFISNENVLTASQM